MSVSIMTPYQISVPGSSIKSPGGLLSKVKTEIPFHNNSIINSSSSTGGSFGDMYSTATTLPLKNEQRSSENQYHDYIRIFSQYGIQVNNLVPTQQASLVLSHILKQITQLPINFLKKLQLKVTISDHPDVFTANGFFRSEDLSNEQKLNDKLYRLIFENLVNNYPRLLILWTEADHEEVQNRGTFSEQIARIHQIENAFYAIMQNKKQPKNKSDIVKLRKLLIEYDPSSFSLEWFKSRNKELKKEFQVHFNF